MSFGIEVADDRLTTGMERVASVGRMLQSTLAHVTGYRLLGQDQIVSILSARAGAPTWLDAQIPEFAARRPVVQSLENLLFMDLKLVEDPHAAAAPAITWLAIPAIRSGPSPNTTRAYARSAFGSPLSLGLPAPQSRAAMARGRMKLHHHQRARS